MDTISAGYGHSTAVIQGRLYRWGKCGGLPEVNRPTLVEDGLINGKRVTATSAGVNHMLILTDEGELFSMGGWRGRMSHAELGLGTDTADLVVVPTLVEGALRGLRVAGVSGGRSFSAAYTDCGELFTWGDAGFHLGHGGRVNGSPRKHLPTLVGGALRGKRVVDVSCGVCHTAVVTSVGLLFTMGNGEKGRLGHGDETNKGLPTQVRGLDREHVVGCSAGMFHTAALTSDGKLYTFGDGDCGQLGHGNLSAALSPKLVEGLRGKRVVANSMGWNHHSAAVTEENGQRHLYVWGYGGEGALGLGDTETRSEPTLVEALRDERVLSVSLGVDHMLVAVTKRGHESFTAMFSWGVSHACLGLGHIPRGVVSRPRLIESLPSGTLSGADGARGGAQQQPQVTGSANNNRVPAATRNAPAAGTLTRHVTQPLTEGIIAANRTHLPLGNLADLDDDGLSAWLTDIAKATEFLVKARADVESEVTRRLHAESVAKDNPDFVCLISHSLMRDPVVAADGHSYERREIEKWFAGGHGKSPMTGAQLANKTLIPSHTVRKAIERAMDAEAARAARVPDGGGAAGDGGDGAGSSGGGGAGPLKRPRVGC